MTESCLASTDAQVIAEVARLPMPIGRPSGPIAILIAFARESTPSRKSRPQFIRTVIQISGTISREQWTIIRQVNRWTFLAPRCWRIQAQMIFH